jgi:hypothetical protein
MAATVAWRAVGAAALLVGALIAYLRTPGRSVIGVVITLGPDC